MNRLTLLSLLACLALSAGRVRGQEQVDKADATRRGVVDLSTVTVRVKVTNAAPQQRAVAVAWRWGGEGLGGNVTRGAFTADDGAAVIPLDQWSKPLPITEIAGKGGGWRFATVVVSPPPPASKKEKAAALTDVRVDFEFAAAGRVIKSFTETAPKGATVGLAVPAGTADLKAFTDDLAGIAEHARRRHERLARLFPGPPPTPKLFGVIGHLAGYGEAPGYGVRHSNPAVVKQECDTLALLGVNGLVGEESVKLADAAGVGEKFRDVHWGGPGSGSPMNSIRRKPVDGVTEENCPYDPAIAQAMTKSVDEAIVEHKGVGARQSWALWWDEIGVAAKAHHQTCPTCREKFVEYLRAQRIEPADVGAKSWDDVKPFPIWPDPKLGDKASKTAPAPDSATDGLRYYYTFRFMTEATAQLFAEPAKRLQAGGLPLYAMQGPTPSWAGHSLDWHEFYDRGANRAFVFETSNRDPRTWQLESYLADIARGICERHGMPMGVLVKPHRGAVAQRMLSVVARGATTVEWYTYGPDYAKGDSFSQSPELLERVARAARFLAANEEYLYGAKPAVPAEVAFCSPRSSEIWGKATDLGVTAFEDAKWVYVALRHANVPVDVISEQQIAEGKLDKYKVLYVVGPNLRRDAGAALTRWVKAGGFVWTDAMGLSRDEANQPAHGELTGLKERKLETWGAVDPYKATELKPFAEKDVPPGATVVVHERQRWTPAVGRELLNPGERQLVTRRFADGRPADVMGGNPGDGGITVHATWVGLSYSARVRRPDFNMAADFRIQDLHDALQVSPYGVTPPVQTSVRTVEAVPLAKGGRRSVALMNWTYRRDGARGEALIPAENLRVELRGLGEIRRVRSTQLGDLKLERNGQGVYVTTLPKIDEIDLLILD